MQLGFSVQDDNDAADGFRGTRAFVLVEEYGPT